MTNLVPVWAFNQNKITKKQNFIYIKLERYKKVTTLLLTNLLLVDFFLYLCSVKNNENRNHTPDFYIKIRNTITKFKRFYVQ